MLEAADAEDWDELSRLERDRQSCLEHIAAPGPVEVLFLDELRQLIELDRTLLARVTEHRQHCAGLISRARRKASAASEYRALA